MIKGGFRIIGITLGSLIAYTLGLSGSAMNSPFYVAGMIALLVAIISLAFPIAEFRCVGALPWGWAEPHHDGKLVVMFCREYCTALPRHYLPCRYSLGMIAYLVPAVLGCAYVGCCNVSTNWHDFAGKASVHVIVLLG